MATFNRNIITSADVASLQAGKPPRTLAASPPAGAATGGPAGPGGAPVYSEDDYLTKLVKYVPLEVLGAYLFIEGVVRGNVTAGHDRALWLGGLLLAFAIVTALYDWRVLSIVRWAQLGISVVGFGVYVFAVGGWFATTTWYQPWYAAIALPFFALLVAIIPVPRLPT